MSRLATRLAVAGALSLVAALAVAAIEWAVPFWIERDIDPGDIHPLRGHAHAVTLAPAPGWPLFEMRGDTHGATRSRLVLLENGRALPIPHAAQPSVESRGAGRYLHLRETELYFSTPDGSSPRTSGRRYSYRTPIVFRSGSLFALFAAGMALVAAATAAAFARTSAIATRDPGSMPSPGLPGAAGAAGARGRSLAFGAAALAFSVLWLALVWQPAPLVVDTGDGGTVASIAAGRLDRESFAADPVLAESATTSFYVAASVPLTAWLARIVGDVGQAYVLPIVAILLAQLYGFWRLGLRLYRNRAWAALVAALSVPPVYVFTGELWGLLAMPLPRSFYGALLPWLLLGLLDREPRRSRWRPYALMLACGAAAWIHPVSAPSVAFGVWLALWLDRSDGAAATQRSLRLVAAGLVFVACIVPIALWLFGGFGAVGADSEARALGARALREAAGAQYFDARLVLRRIVGNGWGWVWIVWIAGAWALLRRRTRHASAVAADDARRLRWFLAGLLLSSIVAAAVDQAVAHALGRAPVQIDLVRNVRFLVPILLLGAVWCLADSWSSAAARPGRRAAVAALAVLLVLGWWHRNPTPPAAALARVLTQAGPAEPSHRESTRRMLVRIAGLAPHSRILPLGDASSEGAIELTGLAIRYASFRPVSFLAKDLNLLSYSGSSGMLDWIAAVQLVRTLQEAAATDPGPALRRLVAETRSDFVLVHVDSVAEPLAREVAALGPQVASEGPWRLVEIAPSAQR